MFYSLLPENLEVVMGILGLRLVGSYRQFEKTAQHKSRMPYL